MRIALLGATSQIASDLILAFSAHDAHELVLFARRPDGVSAWLQRNALASRWQARGFAEFDAAGPYDAIINFVGVGTPSAAAAMGASIFEATRRFDDLAVGYVQRHPACRYIFLSSGAAYGASFDQPADADTRATVAINNLQPQDWYGVAKLYAECCHRSQPELPLVDVRVFNYFSRTQDISARFLITDILRTVRDGGVLRVSPDYMVRDFLHPSDFHQLIGKLLAAPPRNAVVDCYSRAPIDKPALLEAMQKEFGLRYEVSTPSVAVNATGAKPHYYSKNRRAAEFGYDPRYTSLEGIVEEGRAVLAAS